MNTTTNHIAETHKSNTGSWYAQTAGADVWHEDGLGFDSPADAAANLSMQYGCEHITHYQDRSGKVRKISDAAKRRMNSAW